MNSPISNRSNFDKVAFSKAPAPKAKAPAKGESAKPSGSKDRVERDWRDQLNTIKDVLVAREGLGLGDALASKEAGEIIERVLSDSSPTESLATIADRQMAENGMVPEFTKPVLELAAAVTAAPTPDHPSVQDLRHLPMVSVDNGDLNPVTGKLSNASQDIDQVEYAERLPNGNIRVLVGIADVDSAVKKGDLVDQQAMRQGSTVYTDGKIYPMIPPTFSEDLTSLDEKVDRLACIKEFQVTPEGQFVEPKVYRAWVHNRAQMAYDSVNEFLTDGDGARPPQLQDPVLAEQIKLQDEAANLLRHLFHARGSLDIESGEAKLAKQDGAIVGIEKEEQTRAKDKVKFNMMAANISSMRVLEEAGMPTLRRIVKTPEKWDKIVDLAKKFEFELPSDPDAKALNSFLESRKGADPGAHEELCAQVVRLVGRGEYVVSVPNEPIEGHFALAAPDYGHTTAPNRRAPDLVNQRIEKAYAQGEPCPYTPEELTQLAEHFNAQEMAIKKVERRVHQSASALHMKDKVGQTFDGRIHKDTFSGTLVRIKEPFVTGMVGSKLTGETGDEVRVKLVKVNVEKGHIDFALAPEQVKDGFLLKT